MYIYRDNSGRLYLELVKRTREKQNKVDVWKQRFTCLRRLLIFKSLITFFNNFLLVSYNSFIHTIQYLNSKYVNICFEKFSNNITYFLYILSSFYIFKDFTII